MGAAYRWMFGWLSILVVAISVINLVVGYMDGGITPGVVLQQIVDAYRGIIYTGLDHLTSWAPFKLSSQMKDVLAIYFVVVGAGVRLEMLEHQGAFNPFAFLYRFFIGYPMLLALPVSALATAILLAIDPMAFLTETPTRLGVEDNQVALFLGALLMIGGFGNAFKQFKSDFWDNPENRRKLLLYPIQLASVATATVAWLLLSSA